MYRGNSSGRHAADDSGRALDPSLCSPVTKPAFLRLDSISEAVMQTLLRASQVPIRVARPKDQCGPTNDDVNSPRRGRLRLAHARPRPSTAACLPPPTCLSTTNPSELSIRPPPTLNLRAFPRPPHLMATQSAKLVLLGTPLPPSGSETPTAGPSRARLSSSDTARLSAFLEHGCCDPLRRRKAFEANLLELPSWSALLPRGCRRLAGESAVGKSSLVLRFVRDEFSDFRESTIGTQSLMCGLVEP